MSYRYLVDVPIRTLEQGGEEPPFVLRDDSLLQLQRHILQHLARVVGEVQVANLEKTKLK